MDPVPSAVLVVNLFSFLLFSMLWQIILLPGLFFSGKWALPRGFSLRHNKSVPTERGSSGWDGDGHVGWGAYLRESLII